MIVGIGKTLVVGIRRHKTCELLLCQRQIVELVLEYHSRIEQSVLDNLVACVDLLLGERYLCKIILAAVRIVLRAIRNLCKRVGNSLGMGYRVELLLRHLRFVLHRSHHRLVDTLPVVGILALAPKLLEGSLSLANSHRIVEVPQSVGVLLILLGIASNALSALVGGSHVKEFFSGVLMGMSVAEMLAGVVIVAIHVIHGKCEE